MCPRPFQNVSLPLPPFNQATHGERSAANVPPSRVSVRQVIAAITLADYDGALLSLDTTAHELGRLLLNRLTVLAAALQEAKSLQRKAAGAPEETNKTPVTRDGI